MLLLPHEKEAVMKVQVIEQIIPTAAHPATNSIPLRLALSAASDSLTAQIIQSFRYMMYCTVGRASTRCRRDCRIDCSVTLKIRLSLPKFVHVLFIIISAHLWRDGTEEFGNVQKFNIESKLQNCGSTVLSLIYIQHIKFGTYQRNNNWKTRCCRLEVSSYINPALKRQIYINSNTKSQ